MTQREIKFRAWDKVEKEMIEWSELRKLHASLSYIEESERLDARILMQYTGLKDRNGKEIYELDIVRTFYGKIAVVMYLDGSFKLFTNTTDFKPTGTVIGQNVEENYLGYFFQENIEIIGNIYQNPELLQDSTKGVIV